MDGDDEFVEDVESDTLGYQGDTKDIRNFSADIEVNGQRAGSLTANLVDRDRCGRRFHSVCDAESGELQSISCLFFGSSGQPRYSALKSDPSAETGGFLYIKTFHVDAAHRTCGSTDVGSAAIRALLSCAELAGRWTVAAYIADRMAFMSELEKNKDRFARSETDEPEDPTEKATRIAKINDAMARDARQFLRAGFQEATCAGGGWLYVTQGMLQNTTPLTHSAALALPMLLTAPAGQLLTSTSSTGDGADSSSASSTLAAKTTADERLLKQLINRCGMGTAKPTERVLMEVDKGLQEGANLTRAAVLQFCVANGYTELISPLIARGADVNAFDEYGGTPLMHAAAATLRLWNPYHNPKQDLTMVAMLIALGANKNIVGQDGRSALGHYYSRVRGMNDFQATFLRCAQVPTDETISAMLMPERGPTAADEDCIDDH